MRQTFLETIPSNIWMVTIIIIIIIWKQLWIYHNKNIKYSRTPIIRTRLSESLIIWTAFRKKFGQNVLQFPKYHIIMYIFHVTSAIYTYIFHLNCYFLWVFLILKMYAVLKISTFFEVHPFKRKKFNYPNFWLSEWGLVPIDSDNWCSTVPIFNKKRETLKKFQNM